MLDKEKDQAEAYLELPILHYSFNNQSLQTWI